VFIADVHFQKVECFNDGVLGLVRIYLVPSESDATCIRPIYVACVRAVRANATRVSDPDAPDALHAMRSTRPGPAVHPPRPDLTSRNAT
jgi:hypothetical protein